jgi:hypothetical protein
VDQEPSCTEKRSGDLGGSSVIYVTEDSHVARPRGVSMRPKYGVRHAKRRTRTSIGAKILLAAVLVVAGVIGAGGFFPKIIDPEWVRGAVGTRLPEVALPMSGATSVAAVERPAEIATSPALALIPDVEVKANGLETVPLVAAAAKTSNKPTHKAMVPMAKRKIVRVEHRRRGSSYAQDGAGWSGGSSGL